MPVRARASIAPELLSSLRNLIESASGIVLGDAKLPHLSSVVRGRVAALGIPDAARYMEFLSEGERGAAERRDLVSELLVGETGFFRPPAFFQAFEKEILPGLLDQGFVSPLPIWCAGCATGEEAYSVAIAALEGSRGLAAPVRVRATDLHPRFIDAARKGIYPSLALRNLPDRIRETWFTPMKDGRYRVTDAVRRLVDFEEGNLVGYLSGPLPSRAVRGDLLPERDDLLPVGHHAPARRAVSRNSLRRGSPLPRALRNVVGDFGGVPFGAAGEDFLLQEAAREGPPAATRRRSPFLRFERAAAACSSRGAFSSPSRDRCLPRDETGPFGGAAGRRGALRGGCRDVSPGGRPRSGVPGGGIPDGVPSSRPWTARGGVLSRRARPRTGPAVRLRGHGGGGVPQRDGEEPGRRRCGGRGSCSPSTGTCISRAFRWGRGSPRRCYANTCFPVCRDESRDESRCGGPFPLR